ncbi:MAG: lectin like domain-containing protein [Eubacteriales bacterium]|nr:lectin like domain-containing protein [Eubacteriales bacterium]
MIKGLERILTVVLVCLLLWLGYDISKRVEEAETTGKQQSYTEHTLAETNGSLPERYDVREFGGSPMVKNQGALGTCWAVAASSAMEAYFLPEEEWIFSADHLSLQNHFAKGQNDGGDYTMVMAYLAGWQGPVLEADDPYGDGISDPSLAPVKHVQEMQMIKDKDYEAIKQAVYRYGAVQSSIYMDLNNAFSSSVYYNQLEYSYLYNGDERSNHDIIIIGWDDNYPAASFNYNARQNGAFICQNSWGQEFGENGIFYVSYEDVNIGRNAIVYTKIEDTDNYDNLYETDLCGWIGQLGYGDGVCFFANVYEAKGMESLEAVGFYATGKNAEYEISVIENFTDTSSFLKSVPIQSGKIEQAGYYTIPLEHPAALEGGQRFAVMIRLYIPDAMYPVATEYAADESTGNVDISDGEGYISHNGTVWKRTEEEHGCNVCLKVYTKSREWSSK